MRGEFDKPVRVALGRAGSVTFNVTTPEQAAEKLLMEWPVEAGKRHLAARKAVLKAMEHAHDVLLLAKARKAFEAAAEEAGILMPDPPKSLAPADFKPPSWRRKRKG